MAAVLHRAKLIGVLPVLMFGSCETIGPSAAITPAVVAAGAKHGASANDLASGRRIYTTQCVACHSMQPIEKHSLGEWREILNDMSARSKLDAAQKAQLSAYITAAHETMR